MYTDRHNESHEKNNGLGSSDHVEVREFYQSILSQPTHKYDPLIRLSSNTSEAIDDSFSIFSSFASHGLALSQLFFVGLGAALLYNYFFMSQAKHKALKANLTSYLTEIGNKAIPEITYSLWQKRLSSIKENRPADGFEETIKNARPNDLLTPVQQSISNANEQFEHFSKKFSSNGTTSHSQLRQINEVRFIHGQLMRHIALSAAKIKKNPALANALLKNTHNPIAKTPPSAISQFVEVVKKIWVWWLKHYKNIFNGITLTGTFASIIVSIIGISIVNYFPWNMFFSTGLLLFTAGGFFLSKQYFAEEIRELRNRKKKLKNSIKNKKILAELYVTSKELTSQLECKITKASHSESHPSLTPSQPKDIDTEKKLCEALKILSDALSSETATYYLEINNMFQKSQKTRYALTYILPTLFDLSAGYSVGATLLQLTLFAGIRVSMLPFIIIGLVCVVGYTSHALHKAYCLFYKENAKLEALNTNTILKERIELLNNRLKLINHYGIAENGTLLSLENYIKTFRSDQIVKHIITHYKSIKRVNESPELEHIKDRINLIKSKATRDALLSGMFGINNTPNSEKTPINYRQQNRLVHHIEQLRGYITLNLKFIIEGTTFGLSSSASLLLIFGAANLFTLKLTLALLIVSALIGATIATLNLYVKSYHQDHQKKYKEVKNAIIDKETLADLFVLCLEAEHASSQTNEAVTKELVQKAGKLTGSEEDINSLDTNQLIDFRDNIAQLAVRLTLTFQPKQRKLSNGLDGASQEKLFAY